MSVHISKPKAPAPKAGQPNLVSDKHAAQMVNLVNRNKKLEAKLRDKKPDVNAAAGATTGKAEKRPCNGTGSCSGCHSAYHDFAHCFQNPDAAPDVKKRAVEYRARNP